MTKLLSVVNQVARPGEQAGNVDAERLPAPGPPDVADDQGRTTPKASSEASSQ
ncbi:hypothetical protein LWP59_06080 [Amycolatopsis acidiphila]|uniref:hypothetical protein n=1 Tax=Amycolatopsis acidiphila TaxID=715473 RepID=UPI001643CBBC|nr:hypothetical protein [Amycolatopsis acidiphila]UIJ61204.1 hypothetical protein LWP59_06080 [Amycolatopsis acidiphila]